MNLQQHRELRAALHTTDAVGAVHSEDDLRVFTPTMEARDQAFESERVSLAAWKATYEGGGRGKNLDERKRVAALIWVAEVGDGAGFAGEWPRSAADWLSGGMPHLCLEPLDNPDNQDLDLSFTPLSDAEYRQHADDINTMARSFWAARCQRAN